MAAGDPEAGSFEVGVSNGTDAAAGGVECGHVAGERRAGWGIRVWGWVAGKWAGGTPACAGQPALGRTGVLSAFAADLKNYCDAV